jgi:hypothetical protein
VRPSRSDRAPTALPAGFARERGPSTPARRRCDPVPARRGRGRRHRHDPPARGWWRAAVATSAAQSTVGWRWWGRSPDRSAG